MWSCSIWCQIMSFKHRHFLTVRQGGVIVQIIFKCNIINKCFWIKSLLIADDIMNCIFFLQREWFSWNCCCKHSNCITSLTIFNSWIWIAACAIRSWKTSKVRILENNCVIINFMCISQCNTSLVISKEKAIINYFSVATRHIYLQTNLRCISNTAF